MPNIFLCCHRRSFVLLAPIFIPIRQIQYLFGLSCRLTGMFILSFLDSKKHFRLPNGDLIIFKINPGDKQSLYTCSVTNLVTQEQIYSQTFSIKLEGKEQIVLHLFCNFPEFKMVSTKSPKIKEINHKIENVKYWGPG